ncbi:hypothetical protein ACFSHR_17775 [Azotobacter chroococcum]
MELWPGETFRLTLHNELPDNDPSCPQGEHDHNVPHCFNNTNIHTHGLWVSPAGNSDNVHLKIPRRPPSSTNSTCRPTTRPAPSGTTRTCTAPPRCRFPRAWPAR